MSFSSDGTDSPGNVTAVTATRGSPIAVPSICILSLSAIADDPRVRRQGEAFHRAGWEVVAVGVPGAKSLPPDWRIFSAPDLPPRPRARPVRLADQSLRALHYRLGVGATRSPPEIAQMIYWSGSQRVLDIYNIARKVRATVWLANDWTMLPMAARLARENGGIYGYDTHEFAVEEYAESLKWRLWRRPIVSAIERHFIRNATVVSAVSSGIAERLDSLYKLPRPTLTIRNTPPYEEVSFRPTQRDCIKVLYHGAVVANRGIEAAIDSVARWRPEFTLTIRGPENPAFSPSLRKRIAALGLEHRVHLAPAVPMTALVREAAAFDVGFFALPGHSQHNEFALPNKFFEYVMAGLAICTTDLPEMANLIRLYDLGATIAAVEAGPIASAINALAPDKINRFKHNALAAARELCWERESERLVEAYDAALEQTGASVP